MTHRYTAYFISILSSQLVLHSAAWALPQGAEIQHGQVSISEAAKVMEIHQASERAIVHYRDFSIANGERVEIHQPSANSVILNRVVGGSLSEIHGQLSANGQVFLINPAGILVGDSASIDVGGLLLTTHDIDDHDFLASQFTFTGDQQPSVVQIDGAIQVQPGSFVIILAEQIDLGGDIVAQFGTVAMVAADQASILLQPGAWPQIQVDQATYDAWIHHHGLIRAEGGLVEITAASASDLIDRVIFHEGITDVSTKSIAQEGDRTFIRSSSVAISTEQTKGLVEITGQIDGSGDVADRTVSVRGEAVFLRDGSSILNNAETTAGGDTRVIANYLSVEDGAVLEAKGVEGDGGFVELSGHRTISLNGAVDTTSVYGETGHFLIDPQSVTINNAVTTAATATTVDGETSFTPTGAGATVNTSTIEDALENNNVTVTTEDGGGTPDGAIITLTLASDLDLDTSDGNTLTLRSNNLISIEADIEDKGLDGTGGNANIILEAEQDVQMDAGTRIDAGTGSITVNVTNGDFTVAALESDLADGTAVNITVGGSIIDSNDASDNILLNGENAILNMTAGSVINNLQGKVPILRAVSTQQDVKGFTQTQAGDLQISLVESFTAPAIGFTATTVDGDIRVRGITGEANPGIRIGGDGPIILTAEGIDSDIILDANMTTGTGDITITADDGNITMGETVSAVSTSGNFTLSSKLTQTIGLLSTGSADTEAISLEVTGGEDILDAHDPSSDTLNLSAPSGGFRLVNVDNFASLESQVARFTSQNLIVSQIVLNEADGLIIDQPAGNSTGFTLVAGGIVEVDFIDTAGTVSIQANRNSEFYTRDADEVSQENVASISADTIELLANTSIGDVTDDGLSAVDYLDIDTTNLRVELLSEVTEDNANEVAIQQVSSEITGPLVVSELVTPEEVGSAKVFLASLNNTLDLSAADIVLDSTDALGVQVTKAANTNPVEVLLPALAIVESWALSGLALVAEAVGTRIATNETAGSTALTSLTTAAGQLYWASNSDIDVAFSGSDIDLETTSGSIDVQATNTLHIQDLNGDGNALETANGNLSVEANGFLQLSDDITAVDALNNDVREGLIDISTNVGNVLVGTANVDIQSLNTNDSDVDGGLGLSPSDQVAIRIAQNGVTGTANITLGSDSTSVSILAQGGDIYIASGARAASRDVDERTLIVNENTVITAYNVGSDDLVDNVVLTEVTEVDTSVIDPSITTRTGRQVELTSVNIAGFNLEEDVELEAEEAVDDVERSQTEVETVEVVEEESERDTRLSVMLDTVVPGCESGQNTDNSSECMKKQGFKEFLRSLVIGRGFPDKYKGLPE